MIHHSFFADEKRNNLNVIRLLLAIAVIYLHAFSLAVTQQQSLLTMASHGQINEGDIAVGGFFVLSGFLITMSWSRKPHIGEFLKRRFLRIYPGYWTSFLLCLLVVGPLGAVSVGSYFSALPIGNLIKQAITLGKILDLPVYLFQSSPGLLNVSLWTIRIEFECYLLVPILSYLGVLRHRVVLLALTGAMVAGSVAIPLLASRHIAVPEFAAIHGKYGTYFLLGMTAFVFRDRLRYFSLGVVIACIACVLANRFGVLPSILPLAWSYILLYIGFHPRLPAHNFGRHTDISYGMYLYAWPVKRLILLVLPNLGPYPLFFLATIGTIPIALLSWHMIEKPFLRWKEKKSSSPLPSERVSPISTTVELVTSVLP